MLRDAFNSNKVELGTYSLDASHNGFGNSDMGRRSTRIQGLNLSLAAGQKIN